MSYCLGKREVPIAAEQNTTNSIRGLRTRGFSSLARVLTVLKGHNGTMIPNRASVASVEEVLPMNDSTGLTSQPTPWKRDVA
jgi:hypothetical protein